MPGEKAFNHGYDVLSYMHVGQHGACDTLIVRDTTRPTPAEYAPLKAEMESLGYELIVKSRIQYRDCHWSRH